MPKKEIQEIEISSLDMSNAQVLEPVPAGPYLLAVSVWKYALSANGNQKLHAEYTIVGPEQYKGRKIFEDLSLENEFTQGRFMTLVQVLTKTDVKDIKKKKFVPPKGEDMVGIQFTGFIVVQTSTERGDQNKLGRVLPAEKFTELQAKATEAAEA